MGNNNTQGYKMYLALTKYEDIPYYKNLFNTENAEQLPDLYRNAMNETLKTLLQQLTQLFNDYLNNLDRLRVNKSTGQPFQTRLNELLNELDTNNLLDFEQTRKGCLPKIKHIQGNAGYLTLTKTTYQELEQEIGRALGHAIQRYKYELQNVAQYLKAEVMTYAEALKKENENNIIIEASNGHVTMLKEEFRGWEIVYDRGNDWGNPSYVETEYYNNDAKLKEAIRNLDYYDTIVSIKKVVSYELEYKKPNDENDY